MRPSSTARRYAEAAYQVARQDGKTEQWLRDMRTASGVLQDPSIAAYFRNPDTSREDTLASIDRMFPAAEPYVLNLLRVLAMRHRLHLVPSIYGEMEAIDLQAQGIVDAEVTVARPVDRSEAEGISSQLGALTGKRVRVQTRVDPDILGGTVIRIGDKLIDASVAGRLQRLRQDMAV